MNNYLKCIYDDIYRWLVFAETKNAAFLTFVSVFMGWIIGSKDNMLIYNNFIKIFLIVLCTMVIIILIVSYVPFLNSSRFLQECMYHYYIDKKNDNYMFYLNIFLYVYEQNYLNGTKFKQILCNEYGILQEQLSKFEKDLIMQIEATSSIATIKYYCFNVAIKVIIVLILTLLVSALLIA